MPHAKSKPGWLSVTEVLSLVIAKPFLEYWRGKVGNEVAEQIKRESQELGTEVHRIIEAKFRLEDCISENSNANRMKDLFWCKFVNSYQIQPVQLEVTVEDFLLKLQGTFDAHIKSLNGEYLADWKTSNSLDKVSVPLQLAAYCHLYNKDIWKGVVVRIDKEKEKVDVRWYEDLKPYWCIFSACLNVAKYIKFGLKESIDE